MCSTSPHPRWGTPSHLTLALALTLTLTLTLSRRNPNPNPNPSPNPNPNPNPDPDPNPNPNPKQADIWSFGVSISELCSLRHPFAGAASQAALVVRIMAAALPPPPRRYSAPLGRMLQACMQRQPTHRPSALQLLCVPTVLRHAAEQGLMHMLPAEAKANAAAALPPPAAEPAAAAAAAASDAAAAVHSASTVDTAAVGVTVATAPRLHQRLPAVAAAAAAPPAVPPRRVPVPGGHAVLRPGRWPVLCRQGLRRRGRLALREQRPRPRVLAVQLRRTGGIVHWSRRCRGSAAGGSTGVHPRSAGGAPFQHRAVAALCRLAAVVRPAH